MKFTILLSLSLFLFFTTAFAQHSYSVKGVVSDSVEHIKLHNTSVAILNAKDSTLVTFARTDENGVFAINGLSKGKFILLLAYPDYADYVDRFSLDSASQSHNFGNVHLELKTRLLHEVIIKGTAAAIKIKGDTTEFNAAAYNIQPNSKVEDLLKQLPGIQVDKDGKITAQGEKINKVLVDGEEFFGDDPTLVTKNIRADMVDKVQLFDKKSDQAAFTGIDDGKKEKTLNIKLKADKKNGMFGKLEAGGGTNGIYQSQALFNAFKATQKLSVYGTMGNNGKVGLGWEDNQKYGSGNNFDFGDGGMISINIDSQDDLDSFSGQYNGRGLPMARTGGLHYDTKWNSDKESLNTNFKIGSLTVDGTNQSLTQNNLPGTILNSSSDQKFHNYMFRQKLDAIYQIKLDTSSNLKISIAGTDKHSNTRNNYISSEFRNDTAVNNSTRDITNDVYQKIFDASAFYTHKFKKKGRTISFIVSEAYNESQAKGFLNSNINYYNAQGVRDSAQLIDEYKTNDLKSSALSTNLTYTEPLSKTLSIVLNYGINVDNSSANRQSFNASAPGSYNIVIDSLSSNYKLNQLSNNGGAMLNYKSGKTVLNFGTRVADVKFKQIDEFNGNTLDRNFINWMPQGNLQYRFSKQASLNFRYNGRTNQPTLDQIQPLRINNDPLNIVLGNPNLKPSFNNNFNLFYSSYKVISSQYVYFYGNYSITSNPIVNDIFTNPLSGKSTSQYFNLPGKQTANFSLGGNFNKKLESVGLSLGVGVNGNGNVYYALVNDALNKTTDYTINPTVNFNKYKEKKIEFNLYGGPTYNIGRSSLQPNINNNGTGFKAGTYINVYLPWKLQIGTNSDYTYTGKTQSFNTTYSAFIVNASLIKTFLKNDNLKFTIWGNDLLNQNIGFTRTASSNMIIQNSYTTIRRYVMFTIDYDFTKMAAGAPKK